MGIDSYNPTVRARLANASKTRVLSLKESALHRIPEDVKALQTLKHLDLSINYLLVIPEYIGSMSHLKQLNLSQNQLESLPLELGFLPCLEVFNVSQNKLTDLPDLSKCVALKTVDFTENQFTTFPEGICQCPNIETCIFTENRIEVLPDQEMGNDSSKSKSVASSARKLIGQPGPSTSTVNKHLEMATKSRILQLKGTGLKKIPDEIEQLAEVLRNLELSENKIREIPLFIGQFTQLKQLHLSNNCLELLPDEIGSMKKLEILNLAGNKIKSLPDTIVGCTDLRTIDVSSNCFEMFPVAIISCLQLDLLNLNGNQIETLPDEVSELKVIELSLSQNRLKSLNPANLTKAQRLRTLRVDENCLEKSEFTRELLESSIISVIAYDGNRFQLKEFQDLPGYDAYQERFTATKRKI
ncbi:hypothetical protein GCK72_005920 [Caenorhabditis remanei]|uniref:Disease resistance R13L4/SHOC-2-like LRR domain-containing protein n=1 Tax=Caenorhabditis remanei TaxID=31234 RepID=A0A6A5HGX0_CAERE|nr:hypothetical protein GCK72_005920 [Caenorhabditis remanei]KAF1765966.1 hypothetical protein GCK72_005920 [Caenorhabditis remanei]